MATDENIIRTLLGEAGGEGMEGLIAVAHVILNRSRARGKSPEQIVTESGQFDGLNNPGSATRQLWDNPMAIKAAEDAWELAVSGAMPDPTGGATFFDTGRGQFGVSVTPTTQIGRHTFYTSPRDVVGLERAQNAVPQQVASLDGGNADAPQAQTARPQTNWNGNQANLTPAIQKLIDDTQALYSEPLNITSGYRDKTHNQRAEGATHSQHLDGNAVDISLAGMTPTERTALMQMLTANGAKRIGAYSGNSALHVDMADGYAVPDGYPVYPMFDRSQYNMHRAPDWFRNGFNPLPKPMDRIARPEGTAAASTYPTQGQLATMPDGRFNPKPMAEQFGDSFTAPGLRRPFEAGDSEFYPVSMTDYGPPRAENMQRFVPPDRQSLWAEEGPMAAWPPAPPQNTTPPIDQTLQQILVQRVAEQGMDVGRAPLPLAGGDPVGAGFSGMPMPPAPAVPRQPLAGGHSWPENSIPSHSAQYAATTSQPSGGDWLSGGGEFAGTLLGGARDAMGGAAAQARESVTGAIDSMPPGQKVQLALRALLDGGSRGEGGFGAMASRFPYQDSRSFGMLGGRHPFRPIGGSGGHSGGGFG